MSNRNQKKAPANKLLSTIIAVVVVLLAAFGVIDLPRGDTPAPAATAVPVQTASVSAQDEDEQSGPIIEPQAIADYIFEQGRLPDNFITKKEAQKRGWDSSSNYVSDVAPGYSIGGDRFGNYEGLLPDKDGRKWYEADCYYTSGKRNAHRIVYSSDGLVYYTDDHYESFTEMKPSGK